jgi:pyruvate kinase
MKIKKEKILSLIEDIEQMLEALYANRKAHRDWLEHIHPEYSRSAVNLLDYRAFRRQDLRDLQKKLQNLGMSRLANSEPHVEASLHNTHFILKRLIGEDVDTKNAHLSIRRGRKSLLQNTKQLLGYRSKHRRVRIMVTQPTLAATNYQLVHDMVKGGMNCARINCAHDDEKVWGQIIQHVKKASETEGRKVKISMDLGGPKIRTGAIKKGGKIKKFSPERDEAGVVVHPAVVHLQAFVDEESLPEALPINEGAYNQLVVGDILHFSDTREKVRKMKIVELTENYVVGHLYDTCYFQTDMFLHLDREGEEARVLQIGELPELEHAIILYQGDRLKILREQVEGQPAQFDVAGNLVQEAFISCQLEEVFDAVKVGEPILFDDGKIEGRIDAVSPDQLWVKITRAKENGSKLKAEKGINFPVSNLGISGLTAKDKRDLRFVAENADVINFSFVNSAEDVAELYAELEKLGVLDQISVILKIETRQAFDQLSEILLAAMRSPYVGVMIARGDLAVEAGWDNMGWIQREILSLCNAAHVPVVWATQVLENLAKKGLPSRSEITDATSSINAECVMLNKGPFIVDAIRLLDQILSEGENFSEKKEAMLPRLEAVSSKKF